MGYLDVVGCCLALIIGIRFTACSNNTPFTRGYPGYDDDTTGHFNGRVIRHLVQLLDVCHLSLGLVHQGSSLVSLRLGDGLNC